jgi:sigma-B regulation protein RsbU (phosphoserine phosphatase)
VTQLRDAWEEERREVLLACDRDGRITWADPKALQQLGPCLQTPFVRLVAPGLEDKAASLLARGLVERIEDFELPVLAGGRLETMSFCAKPDGAGGVLLRATRLPEEYARALLQAQQSMDEVVELNRQVGRHKHELQLRNDALERASSRLTEVLESTADGFVAVDSEWRIVLINLNAQRAAHDPSSTALGRVFWDVFPNTRDPSMKFWAEYHRCLEQRVPLQFVEQYRPSGVWIEVRASPTVDGGMAAFFRNVSLERQAALALERTVGLEQQLIGIVSHDLRNPLSAILLNVSMLRREALSERAAKSLRSIQTSAERGARMVADLLDFTLARLGDGIPVHASPLDLHALVRSVIEEIETGFPERVVQLLQEGNAWGECDSDRMAQVVSNLVTNALKYSPPDSTVRVTTRGEEGHLVLQVHNRSAALPSAQLARIFEPMTRLASEVDNASRSVGLGLYIVKHLVDAHRGTVEVASSESEGTTFTVRLPRTRIVAKPDVPAQPAAA